MTGRGPSRGIGGRCFALYGVLGLTSVEFVLPAWLEPWFSPLIGAATGLVAAATGVVHDPLRSLPAGDRVGKRTTWCRRSGCPSQLSTLALAATLVQDGGPANVGLPAGSLLALAPALIGNGGWASGLRASRAPPKRFRNLLLRGGSLLLGAPPGLAVR